MKLSVAGDGRLGKLVVARFSRRGFMPLDVRMSRIGRGIIGSSAGGGTLPGDNPHCDSRHSQAGPPRSCPHRHDNSSVQMELAVAGA